LISYQQTMPLSFAVELAQPGPAFKAAVLTNLIARGS
jgi:hypothetical protein